MFLVLKYFIRKQKVVFFFKNREVINQEVCSLETIIIFVNGKKSRCEKYI